MLLNVKLEDEREQFDRVAKSVFPQAKLIRAWRLAGGISARMTALAVETQDSAVMRVVVRQLFLAAQHGDSHAAKREYDLLLALSATGLPVPVPYVLDETGTVFADPYLVIAYLDGATDYAPVDWRGYVAQMAAQLARIHALSTAQEPLSQVLDSLPRHAAQVENLISRHIAPPEHVGPTDSLAAPRLGALLKRAQGTMSRNPQALLHGDFWPGNILWRSGELVGVVDWEDAALGDPVADLAISRLDLLWLLGPDAMNTFTDDYRALMPYLDYGALPVWDLFAALRALGWLREAAAGWANMGRPDITEESMRARLAQFVEQATSRRNIHTS
jgi:aminoglycoside phosphotransferase (APT) family kinase protein